MLRSRIVPFLLLSRGEFVKTRGFRDPKYVGDPLNTVRIFNEKEADEISIFDISATLSGSGPDFPLLARLAGESRMPLSYCGGVSDADQVVKLISLGVEKAGFGSTFLHNPEVVSESARAVGSQSVFVVLNYRTEPNSPLVHNVYDSAHSKSTKKNLREMALRAESMGAGEIVLSSMDRDGTMIGYDLEVSETIRNSVSIPITILGGAGTLEDLRSVSAKIGPTGLGVGSMFVFTGKFRSVLVQYPSWEDRRSVYAARPGEKT